MGERQGLRVDSRHPPSSRETEGTAPPPWRKEPLKQRNGSEKSFPVLVQLSGEDVAWEPTVYFTRHLKRSSPQFRGRLNLSIVPMGKLRLWEQK